MRQIEQDKLKLILELKGNPIVLVACKKIGVPTSTFYRWKNDDKRFAKEANRSINKGRETVSDIAEAHLVNYVKKGDVRSVFYWLKTFRLPYKKSERSIIEIKTDKSMVKKTKSRTDGVVVPTIESDDAVKLSPKIEKQFERLFRVWFKRNDREKALVQLLVKQGINIEDIKEIMNKLPN